MNTPLSVPAPEENVRPSRLLSPDMYDALHPSFFSKGVPATAEDIATNRFQVIPTARLFFQRLIQKIETAEQAVDLQFYTVEADDQTEPILLAAAQTARRGVPVRLHIDHLVSDPRRLVSTIRQHRELNKIPAMSVQHMTTKRPDTGNVVTGLTSRDHKKIALIDPGTEHGSASIGGINLAARNLRWNDFMVEMNGPIMELIAQDFEDTWTQTNRVAKDIQDMSDDETYLLTDTSSGTAIVPFARDRIARAQRRVWLETPYLDMADIGQVLLDAKGDNPNLDVRVIVPRFNNSPIDRLRTSNVVNVLERAGIAAYRYGRTYRRLNHAKALLIDDMVLFGSSNFNTYSLAGNNAEIEVATKNPDIVGQLERWYVEDQNESLAG